MLRNTLVNTFNFFFPIGNTPAVSLTRDLAPEQDAAILILGCGDVRNILFTTWADRGRRLDFTCCDIEPAILARNIFLFSLTIDDTTTDRSVMIWNLYYHLKVDAQSLELLEYQAWKLFQFSDTLENWNSNEYGRHLRFCDKKTLQKIRSIWFSYLSKDMLPADKMAWDKQLQSALNQANILRKKQTDDKPVALDGFRSAALFGPGSIQDPVDMHNHFWGKAGSIDSDPKRLKKSIHNNPMFLSSPDQALVLHYGLDPLQGFHLASAYIPIHAPFSLPADSNVSSKQTLLWTVKSQFRLWCESFKKLVKEDKVVIRFCASDALAFSHTMQKSGNANLSRSDWTFEPLVLDSGDYDISEGITAPVRFNSIDTSNLADQLGPVNILVAAAPLLIPCITSTLNLETLTQYDSSVQDRMQYLLCSDFCTVAMLLGVACMETWINATAVPNVEENKPVPSTSRLRSRLFFKNLAHLPTVSLAGADVVTSSAPAIRMSAQDLSRLMYSIHTTMFPQTPRVLHRHGLPKPEVPCYNRASFATLLKHMRTQVESDWGPAVRLFLAAVEKDKSMEPLEGDHLQELYLYLHQSGIYTVDILKERLTGSFVSDATEGVSAWKAIPPVVCVTIEVPRAQIRKIIDMPFGTSGRTSLQCTIQSTIRSKLPFLNSFCAVQMGFGEVKLIGEANSASARLEVEEDLSNWAGKAPMIVSFYVPSRILLQERSKTIVACGFQDTFSTRKTYTKMLGPGLKLFETTLDDISAVHITRLMPNMKAYPTFVGHQDGTAKVSQKLMVDCAHSVSVKLLEEGTRITFVTYKIRFLSENTKTALADANGEVKVQFKSPMRAEVMIGSTLRCEAHFPVPVDGSKHKLQIGTKSSSVEIVAPFWQALDNTTSHFLFPMSVAQLITAKKLTVPIRWNIPYVYLVSLGDIDLRVPEKNDWLRRHLMTTLSTRERKVKDTTLSNKFEGMQQDLRVELKKSIFSMFTHYSGVVAPTCRSFSLGWHEAGSKIIFLVSSMKLDPANNTILLDAAVIPLTDESVADDQVRIFLMMLHGLDIRLIHVDNDELRLWKSILPAFAERCRIWSHKATCEYIDTGEVPPPEGLEPGKTPLCSCGIGHFPAEYLSGLWVPHMGYVLATYATRVAISPVFYVPYVEVGIPFCTGCGASELKSGEAGALLMCSRCKKVPYCSRECQVKDWKEHKPGCVPVPSPKAEGGSDVPLVGGME